MLSSKAYLRVMDVQKIIENPKRFLALTSLRLEEFSELLGAFSARWQAYFKHYNLRGKRRNKPLTSKQLERNTSKLHTDQDKLFFILYFFKNNDIQESLGAHFDMDQGHISRWIKVLTPILQQSIKDLHLQPARDMDELIRLFRSRHKHTAQDGNESFIESLHIDGVERHIQRNKDFTAQRYDFSGKKRQHTLKNTVICDEFQFIHFAPHTHRGAIHDKAMIEQELPDLTALTAYRLWFSKDSGYQAYQPSGVHLLAPYRAARNHPLTGLEKLVNTYVSSVRVVVEHAIKGVKRCRLLSERLRYFDSTFRDIIFFIGCGLHNLRVSRRSAYTRGACRVRARINFNFF